MATMTMNYAAPATITCTLASLADTAYRQSASVSNNTNKYLDALVGGIITTGTSPTAGEVINVYAYGRTRTSTFTAGASGSDAAYTADGEEGLFKLLAVIAVDATSDQGYEFGPVSVREAFGGILPEDWGLVINNETGVALNATGGNHVLEYVGVKYDSA